MHWYWFTLIIRIAWRKVAGNKLKDARSDDDEKET